MKITLESNITASVEYVSFLPIKKTEEFRKNDTPYAVFSFKKNNKICKKPHLIGVIIKSRTNCLFFPHHDIGFTSETFNLINNFIKRINDKHLWFDYKKGVWKND